MDAIKDTLISALPDIYQPLAQDPSSPLHAIIATAETNFSRIVAELDQVETNFDPQRAATETDPKGRGFLNWLAGWLMLDPDATWPEAKSRFLIRQAADLYRMRGTAQGIKALIEAFFDIEVEIIEWQWPRGMVIGRQSTLNVDSRLIESSGDQSCFEVRWHPRPEHLSQREQMTSLIRNIIDREKPAHTRCHFNVIKHRKPAVQLPNLVVNVTSTIGGFVIS